MNNKKLKIILKTNSPGKLLDIIDDINSNASSAQDHEDNKQKPFQEYL